MIEQTINKTEALTLIRSACHQFAKLYFQMCKTLVDQFGIEEAKPLIQKTIFNLSLDRSDGIRERAQQAHLECTVENFMQVQDIPFIAWSEWTPAMGGVRCPYAEVWLQYIEQYPWFKSLASLYCEVIDTTNIENFSRTTSHRITKNLLWGDPSCEREYFPSPTVQQGTLTYGTREPDHSS